MKENQKEEFIKAIENDESYEFEITDNVWIHTDTEFDGTFFPAIFCENPENWTKQDIDDLLVENDIHEIFTWHLIEWDNSNNCWYPIVENCEYEEIDHSIWE